MLEKLFKLKENGTRLSTEIVAGLTTFFAMSYIIIVNPAILSQSGMECGAVFLATIIASIIGTLVMGLVANVPYAQAPGMGLNAFFVYTVCFGLGFTWQQALSMVFVCGLLNIIITVTKVRKYIIKAIPESLQNAIGGGIGIFIAYIGLLNVGIINFGAGVPALSTLNQLLGVPDRPCAYYRAPRAQGEGRGAHSDYRNDHYWNPVRCHYYEGIREFLRGLRGAAHYVPCHLQRGRNWQPILRSCKDSASSDYDLLLQPF